MLLRSLVSTRRRLGRVTFDERTGAVCDAACRAASRREGDLTTMLRRRGLP
jgi:hypothetical protein